MHTTFYLLLIRSRSLGSSFWLPLAILSSAILALLTALPIAMALKIPIDPVALTEALPFLVCTVGFDKPLRLARAVFLHPHLSVPPSLVPASSDVSGYPTATTASAPNGSLSPTRASSQNHTLKPAPKIITESLSLVYAPIIRDYVLEVAVLTVGAYSKVGGLKEVCALAALILAVDCLLLCTYLAAILGIMVEVSCIFVISRSFVIRIAAFFIHLLWFFCRKRSDGSELASCFFPMSESLCPLLDMVMHVTCVIQYVMCLAPGFCFCSDVHGRCLNLAGHKYPGEAVAQLPFWVKEMDGLQWLCCLELTGFLPFRFFSSINLTFAFVLYLH